MFKIWIKKTPRVQILDGVQETLEKLQVSKDIFSFLMAKIDFVKC